MNYIKIINQQIIFAKNTDVDWILLMFLIPFHLILQGLLQPFVPVIQVESEELLSVSVEQGPQGPHGEKCDHKVWRDTDQSVEEMS